MDEVLQRIIQVFPLQRCPRLSTPVQRLRMPWASGQHGLTIVDDGLWLAKRQPRGGTVGQQSAFLRFDVLRAADDPRAFLLVEVYDSPEAAAAHKQTPHYAEWREEVQDMMAEPRQATAYVARFPEDPGAWKMRLSEA